MFYNILFQHGVYEGVAICQIADKKFLNTQKSKAEITIIGDFCLQNDFMLFNTKICT